MRIPVLPHPGAATLRAVVLVLGLWYLALGIAGFAVGGTGMGADVSRSVWLFGTSALLNIGHTGVGVLGLAATRSEATVRAFGWLGFFGFTGIFAYSVLAVTLSPLGNLANMRPGNVWLYAVTALLGLFVCVAPLRGSPATDPAT
ncbi:DUF4383 domain-containing protein [Saccharomonospora piscinae]|uniref:DUF4383 domain-containing protein n=1 Tax=Saccharomonospora piscinae TaxID=687388 RepID=UPI0004649F89|nr:DUF4383 domain-containing protein [Saccharomonospora piscinae]